MMLKDKVAVIYGAGGGIGGAVARAFASEGASVFLTGRDRAPVDAVAEGIATGGGFAEAATVDALDAERRDDPVGDRLGARRQQRDHALGDRLGLVEVGFGRIVLDLDVDESTGARVERLAERQHVLRQVDPLARDDLAPVGESGIVVHHDCPVGRAPGVELDAGGAHADRGAERLPGVLPLGARCAPMRDDVRHVRTLTLVTGEPLT